MKPFYWILILLVISCAKVDKPGIETEQYKDLIGTWIETYPNDEERKIIIHENGKVEVFKSTERGEKFLVTEFKYNLSSGLIVGNDTLPICSLSGYHDGNPHGYVRVAKKLYSDTAYFGFGPYINNFEIDTNSSTPKLISIRE